MSYIYLAFSIFLNVSGQLLMKVAADKINFDSGSILETSKSMLLNGYVILGAGFYLAGLVAWLLTLSKLDLSIAYPFQALSFVIIIGASFIIFKEPFNMFKVIGTLLILGGILVLGYSISKDLS